jgi:hypothetical protein
MYGLNGDIAQDLIDVNLTNQLRDELSINKKVKQLSNIFNLYTMKTRSKVKQVQGSGNFDWNGSTLYKFEYQMEDGTVLVANHKTQQCPFNAGDEVEYEVTKENQYGKQGKVGKPQEAFVPQGSTKAYDNKGIKVGHAITNAVSLFVTNGSYEAMNMKESIKAYAKMIYQISEELNNEL